MEDRSSSTMLPPVRRQRRRDWGRIVARVLCVVFALAGLVPVGIGLLTRTRWARAIATHETQKLIAGYGVNASYELELKLWPLSVTLRNVRVEASDGGTPFLTARRASARPKLFGLLAGKLVIDSIEVEQPNARVVLKGGQLQNLALKLPEPPLRWQWRLLRMVKILHCRAGDRRSGSAKLPPLAAAAHRVVKILRCVAVDERLPPGACRLARRERFRGHDR